MIPDKFQPYYIIAPQQAENDDRVFYECRQILAQIIEQINLLFNDPESRLSKIIYCNPKMKV